MAAANRVSEKECLRALISKQAMPLILLVVFAWIILRKADTLDFTGIFAAVHAISGVQWSVAVIAAIVSFWAIGQMDTVMHRIMDTGVPARIAQLSGITSVATAQLTGFGLLTGTLARWRVLPDTSLWKAAQITGAVSLSFMASLGVITAAMVLVARPDIPASGILAVIALLGGLAIIAVTVWRPRRLMPLRLPPLKGQFALLGYSLLDTMAAALTLYVLIPDAALPPPLLFYTVFLLALGAGLLGTTPGGIGPFEMMFLACLPQMPDASILAAIMAYRLVYFALPALLALALLIAGPAIAARLGASRKTARLQAIGRNPAQPVAVSALCFNATRAEAGLMRQGEFELLLDAGDNAVALAARAGQSLIMLADPLRRENCARNALLALGEAAARQMLTPCVYKCSARTAAAARRIGWKTTQVAQEAIVDPQAFDLDQPARRQLRRSLRQAAKAGVGISEAGAELPIADMTALAALWADNQGGARGFSMGRFDEKYIRGQRVLLARHSGKLVGFLTLHEAWSEMALDLICMAPDAPAGTMHLLVFHAIQMAAQQGCTTLSLAAVPCLGATPGLPRLLRQQLDRTTGANGLYRFKNSFAPVWRSLFVAAPTRPGLAMAGLDLVDRITRPRALLSEAS